MNDNNFNYEELENALKLIQNVCREASGCETCPFGNNNGDCLITENMPGSWEFADPTPVIRLMK